MRPRPNGDTNAHHSKYTKYVSTSDREHPVHLNAEDTSIRSIYGQKINMQHMACTTVTPLDSHIQHLEHCPAVIQPNVEVHQGNLFIQQNSPALFMSERPIGAEDSTMFQTDNTHYSADMNDMYLQHLRPKYISTELLYPITPGTKLCKKTKDCCHQQKAY